MSTGELKNFAVGLARAPRVTTLMAVALTCVALASTEPASAGWQTFHRDNGLADDQVVEMMEDRAGNLWFATDGYGVSRYDGTSWRTFTYGDGLADGTVRSMYVDRAGNVWIGTGNGVSRYDGTSWRTFTSAEGLTGYHMMSMFEDRSGNLWVGKVTGGVSRFDGTSWRTFTTADGLAGNTVTGILQDLAGNLWFATSFGVSLYDGSSWRTVTTAGATHYYTDPILMDRAGNVWVATTRGVGRYDGSSWRMFTTADGLGTNDARSLLEDHAGNVWAATSSGVSRYDGSSWHTFKTADGLGFDYVLSLVEDRTGNLWAGTYGGGVSRYDGTSWRTFTTADGLTDDHVDYTLRDRVGNLWFATYGGGVSRYDGSSWRTFDASDGLTGGHVSAIVEDRARNLWFGTTQGVSRYDGSSWRTFTTADGLADSIVNCMLQDRAGNMWFGTETGGASRFDSTSWRTFTHTDGLPADFVISLLQDRAGNLWFGTGLGVSRYDGSNWRTFTTADGLGNDAVTCMLEDHTGNLWFGTFVGVSRYDGSSWRTFTTADGLGNNQVLSLAEDRAGNLWVGTNGGGVARYDGTNWRTFTTADGLAYNSVYSIVQDQVGIMWFGTDDRVSRFDGSTWRTFSTADGLFGNNVTSIVEDRAGSLWFGTGGGGVTRYDVDRVSPRTLLLTRPPHLTASRIQSARFSVALGETRVEFAFRLDGDAWSGWSAGDVWIGNDLADGVHRLEVRSRDYSTNVDSTGVVASFEIDATPPAPIISVPAFGQVVKGVVGVHGTAADGRFKSYRVESRPAGATTWSPPEAAVLATVTAPVTDGSLATWDTSTLADGNYELRLSVADTLGLVGTYLVGVVVDNQAPFADVTAPATVSATSGGDLYTTHSELHLYFPPHAFDQDARVTIVGGTAPDALSSGAVRVQPDYAVDWGSAALRKGATLEFSTTGRGAGPGSLAVYFSHDGSNWRRLGGTSEPGKVSLVVREAGHYALYAETGIAEGAATLSDLSFTPRVFSPAGTFASGQLAIGFTLGRSSPVTVRVYNRAGRLIRELVAGEPLPAGANLVHWNGRDRQGDVVPDGPYVVTVEALGETRRSPLAVVR